LGDHVPCRYSLTAMRSRSLFFAVSALMVVSVLSLKVIFFVMLLPES
jgi:hypothetical protein